MAVRPNKASHLYLLYIKAIIAKIQIVQKVNYYHNVTCIVCEITTKGTDPRWEPTISIRSWYEGDYTGLILLERSNPIEGVKVEGIWQMVSGPTLEHSEKFQMSDPDCSEKLIATIKAQLKEMKIYEKSI